MPIKTMPIHWFLICICFNGINFINCMEDVVDPIRRGHRPIWNETYADALKRDLLMSYDKFARPTQHYNTTTVTIDLRISHVDFDETTSIFTVYALFAMEWNDDKLKWNESNYGNFSSISLAQHEIWQPDITLINSINHNVDYYGVTNLVVKHNGNVVWVPPTTLKTLCDTNLRYWPFDSHTCTLQFGSWVHRVNEIDVIAKHADHLLFDSLIENPEWIINDVQTERKFGGIAAGEFGVAPYVTVYYKVTVERRSSIYQTLILAPAFVVILLILLTFWLPAEYGEKIVLNAVTALIIVLFLLYFSQQINVMASHTPLIVLFYSHALYLVCFSTLIAVVVINLTRMKHGKALPYSIKKYLDGKIGEILLLDHDNDSEIVQQLREHPLDEHIPNDELQQIIQCRRGKNPQKSDYRKLATSIDRIAFLCYSFLFTLFAIAYSI